MSNTVGHAVGSVLGRVRDFGSDAGATINNARNAPDSDSPDATVDTPGWQGDLARAAAQQAADEAAAAAAAAALLNPPTAPTVDSEEVARARRRQLLALRNRGGRAGTVLTSDQSDQLGG